MDIMDTKWMNQNLTVNAEIMNIADWSPTSGHEYWQKSLVEEEELNKSRQISRAIAIRFDKPTYERAENALDVRKTMDAIFQFDGPDGFSDIVAPVSKYCIGSLNNFLAGYAGNAFEVGGNVLRMLYLSVVVMTTLGLGDIVPISGLARFLVGSEALAGIVLMGLFFNAVATSAQKQRRSPPADAA